MLIADPIPRETCLSNFRFFRCVFCFARGTRSRPNVRSVANVTSGTSRRPSKEPTHKHTPMSAYVVPTKRERPPFPLKTRIKVAVDVVIWMNKTLAVLHLRLSIVNTKWTICVEKSHSVFFFLPLPVHDWLRATARYIKCCCLWLAHRWLVPVATQTCSTSHSRDKITLTFINLPPSYRTQKNAAASSSIASVDSQFKVRNNN